jgi:hypothetical protein
VADAKAAAQRVCSQLLMLNGTLDLSNKMLGPRTADVSNVAMNRTLAAGISVKKVGVSSCPACAHDAAAPTASSHETAPRQLHTTSAAGLSVRNLLDWCCNALEGVHRAETQLLDTQQTPLHLIPDAESDLLLLLLLPVCLQTGKAISNATLFLQNVTLYIPISPVSKDLMSGVPGVEFSTASYTLTGNVVAAADLTKASSWQQVSLDKVSRSSGFCLVWHCIAACTLLKPGSSRPHQSL